MPWLDLIGWFGSALLIVSVMQARLLRFRVLNLFDPDTGAWSLEL